MQWSCTCPDELAEWVPDLTVLASHTLSSLPRPMHDTQPASLQKMLAGLARQRLRQVEEYRLSLVRLPGASDGR
jgi:hypothetical protein